MFELFENGDARGDGVTKRGREGLSFSKFRWIMSLSFLFPTTVSEKEFCE